MFRTLNGFSGLMGEVTADRLARYVELIARERETMEELAIRVAGGETLPQVCAAWDVPYGRLAAWVASDTRRSDVYEGARRIRADAIAEDVIDISDGKRPVTDGEPLDHQRDALRVKARQWALRCWDPRRYGDRTEVTGAGGTPLVPADRDQFLLQVARSMGLVLHLASQATARVIEHEPAVAVSDESGEI